MGLFSFTDEEYERYQGREPVDPRAVASEAMARISAARATEADVWVAQLGPRAAWARRADPGAPRVDDLRHAIDAIACRAEIGTPEAFGERAALDAWLSSADDDAIVLATRRALVRQFRQIREDRRGAYADRAATGAVTALARLDRTETVHD